MQQQHNRARSDELKARRRQLRQKQTKAEKVFWQEVRACRTGYHVRRQHNISAFIVDFYCHEVALIIELDGPIHRYTKDYDRWRQAKLESWGYYVIRYNNNEVLFDRERVLNEVLLFCEVLRISMAVASRTSPCPSPCPSLRSG